MFSTLTRPFRTLQDDASFPEMVSFSCIRSPAELSIAEEDSKCQISNHPSGSNNTYGSVSSNNTAFSYVYLSNRQKRIKGSPSSVTPIEEHLNQNSSDCGCFASKPLGSKGRFLSRSIYNIDYADAFYQNLPVSQTKSTPLPLQEQYPVLGVSSKYATVRKSARSKRINLDIKRKSIEFEDVHIPMQVCNSPKLLDDEIEQGNRKYFNDHSRASTGKSGKKRLSASKRTFNSVTSAEISETERRKSFQNSTASSDYCSELKSTLPKGVDKRQSKQINTQHDGK